MAAIWEQFGAGLCDGIYVKEGASPAITGNTLARNAWDAIEVAEGAHSRIGQDATAG